MEPNSESKVDQLNDTLNSRTKYRDPMGGRRAVDQVELPEVKEGWQSPGLDELLMAERRLSQASPLAKKIFVFAVLFFIMAILVAGYVFFGGSNFISSKNVDITIDGPTKIQASNVLELGVTVKNKNNAGLDVANLSITYPSGTRSADDTTKSLTYTKESLGEMSAGKEITKNVRAVIFGSAGETKDIKFSVEYKVSGSNATFYKDKVYTVTIDNAPFTFQIDTPDSVTSGDTFTTRVSVELNSSTELLKDVMVRAEYPYGYTFTDSSPDVAANNNVWSLGDLLPGAKKTIVLHGKLVGQNGEDRTFRFYAGVSDNGTANPNFKTVLSTNQKTISIARPSIDVNIALNGATDATYSAPAATPISAVVSFDNNLPDKLLNPHLEVRLTGTAIDKSSVSAAGGFYDPATNKITWSLTNNNLLPQLAPGDGGQVNFRFASLANLAVGTANHEIGVTATITGTPVGKTTPVSVTESRTVKISSQVNLSSKMLYSRGPFTNHGPTPPKAGTETTYTAILDIGNTGNEVKGAKVVAHLGQNVKWLGADSNGSESVTYNAGSNTVTWDIGTLASGSGFSTSLREVAFQVAFTPSTSQIGTAPILVSGIQLTGQDSVAGTNINVTNPSLTTNLSSDPVFVQGDDIVVK